ncbi:MAG TPA: hypothetical protein VG759_02470 [Candidatus Angelobacter sp.]|jgi:hypothetical protein|nr:hypothetical protein [Candidatus Angelobacter sp.]
MMQGPLGFGTIGDNYDIFSIRAVLAKLAPDGKAVEIETRIEGGTLIESEKE